jgi:hypothetical protein
MGYHLWVERKENVADGKFACDEINVILLDEQRLGPDHLPRAGRRLASPPDDPPAPT